MNPKLTLTLVIAFAVMALDMLVGALFGEQLEIPQDARPLVWTITAICAAGTIGFYRLHRAEKRLAAKA